MIISAIVGFSAGSSGIAPQEASGDKIPITPFIHQACYDPQTDLRITLKWPDNFQNVPDYRPQLNPGIWGDKGLPSTFAAASECQNFVMNDKAERTYILVRKNARIPSCKTDELAGPHGNGICHGWKEDAPELTHRGTCSTDGYTDLRKVAQAINPEGKSVEIFWNPFSHNVGCNYSQDHQDENCGPGQRRNLNLKDFIYVLNSREAFDPDNLRSGCPVRWDAGSTDGDACSHYFDVYMAYDLYQAEQSAPATDDPESPYYFIRQVLQNCQEDTRYIPAIEANLTMPPIFIETPFFAQNAPLIYSEKKIIPNTSVEKTNYLTYIWGRPDLVIPFKSNLLTESTINNSKPLNICAANTASMLSALSIVTNATTPTAAPPTIIPLANCYDSLGKIYFKDDKGAVQEFNVYSKPTSPEHFYLVKKDDITKIYSYVPTDKDYPTNLKNNPSLQLRKMEMIAKNQWTWATPWCKPAIYLYPQQPENVSVKLDLDGELTVSNPKYDATSGWNVFAYPDGTITQPLNLSDYPYLYYEANLNNVNLPKEGWVIERAKIKDQISKILKEIGFNDKEKDDFLKYWLPRLNEKPYYFVSLLPENVINEKEKLTFSVAPDTLIRSRFVFEGLDAPVSVPPLTNIPHHDRMGFTVTDWGGTLVGKSCSNVEVK